MGRKSGVGRAPRCRVDERREQSLSPSWRAERCTALRGIAWQRDGVGQRSVACSDIQPSSQPTARWGRGAPPRPIPTNPLPHCHRETSRSLALVCILKDSVLQQQGLLEYNFACFRDALFNLFHLRPPIDIV